MPASNDLKITQARNVGKRMADDMPLRNDIFTNREIITKLTLASNPYSMTSLFFGKLGQIVGSEGGEDQQIRLVGEGISTEFIRNRTIRDVYVPPRVIDASRVPARIVAGLGGNSVTVTLSRPTGGQGTILRARDGETNFMVASERESPDQSGAVEVTLQLNGPPGASCSGDLLRMDSPLNGGRGNSMGEGSLGPNAMMGFDQMHTDDFQVLQIMRLGLIQTGSALAEGGMTGLTIEETQADGSRQKVDVYSDIPWKGIQMAMRNFDMAVMDSTPNFNAKTRQIANQISNGRYSDRPTFAGLYWFMDHAPRQYFHYLSSPKSAGVKLLDRILRDNKNKVGGFRKMVAVCQGIGYDWIKDVFGEAVLVKKYNIQVQVDNKQKLGGGTIGYDIDEYYTRDGSISVLDMGQSLRTWGVFDQSSYNGNTSNNRSKRIYLMPAFKQGTGGELMPMAKLFYKEKEGISRLFSLGITRGHTGQNGPSGAEMLKMSDEGIRKMLNNERFRTDSTVDGNEISVLSHFAAYMDTDHMVRINLI